MPRKIGPEARIIALFNALPDDSKRIVMEIIKSQQPVVKRGKPAPSVKGKSKQRSAEIPFTHPEPTDQTGRIVGVAGD